MATYKVKFYKGDYSERQAAANKDKAICYVEQHFNGSSSASANYALVVVASNAGETSKSWGRQYSQVAAREFGIPDNGVSVGGYLGRGNANLMYTNMPAILLEPFFITNKSGSKWANSESGRQKLAEILVESIRAQFPLGGLVAFSVGHKYKKSSPNDRGVQSVDGPMEADLAEKVLEIAAKLLEGEPVPEPDPTDPEVPTGEPIATSEWANDARDWVMKKKISDGTRPQDPVTREELWVMLHRMSKS